MQLEVQKKRQSYTVMDAINAGAEMSSGVSDHGHPFESIDRRPWNECNYDTLAIGHIRMLCLEPGLFGSPLIASIEQKALKEAQGAYEAVSYAWGEHNYCRSLRIERIGSLMITEPLSHALQYLRLKDKARWLWIDAVCINQANKNEQSHQVEIMAEIFRSASNILVWLGIAGVDDALAFATLSVSTDRDGRASTLDFEYFQEELTRRLANKTECDCCNEKFEYPGDDACFHAAARAVLRLTERPWFSRLWVWQEVYSSAGHDSQPPANRARLCCGTHVAPFASFRFCLNEIIFMSKPVEWRGDEILASLQRAREILSLHHQATCSQPFSSDVALRMQVDCASRLCSDPRDRIFAMRHLMQIEAIDELRPDYSLSTEEAYRRFIVACIKHRSMLPGVQGRGSDARCAISWIFALVNSGEATLRDKSWPSWVPDFNGLSKESSGCVSGRYQDKGVSRGFKQNAAILRYQIDPTRPRELSVKGLRFAKVGEVLIESSWPVKGSPRRPASLAESTGYLEMTQLVHWYLRCTAFIEDHTQDPAVYEWLEAFLVQESDSGFCRLTQYSGDWEIVQSFLSSIDCAIEIASIMEVIGNRRPRQRRRMRNSEVLLCHLVGDKFDDVAWVPKTAIVGDTFCMFGGQPYPFLLRAHGDGRYTVIGDTMLGGLNLMQVFGMDAETVKLKLEQDWPYDEDPARSWRTEDENLQRLIDGFEWITLR